MRKLMGVVLAIAAVAGSTIVAQADSKLSKQIVGKSFCYASGRKITFNPDGTMPNNFGKERHWSVDRSGANITYSGPGFSHTVSTTIDASGALTETDPSSGRSSTASPC